MSDNKNKYFEVVTTQIVSAPTKSEALLVAQRKRVPGSSVLATDIDAERITAAEARSFADS